MGNVRRQLLVNSLKVLDLSLMMFSFGLATIALTEHAMVSLPEFFSMRVRIQNFVIFSGLLLVWHIIFRRYRMYGSRRLSSRWEVTADIAKATSLGTLSIMLAAVVFRIVMITPMFLVVFWTTSTVTTIMSRLTLRYVLRRIRLRGRNLRDMLIVGTNEQAVQFARKIERAGELGYRVIGFADEEWPGLAEFHNSGYRLACGFADLRDFLRANVVDEVAIALPMRSLHSQASRVVAICEEQGIILRLVSNIFNLKLARSKSEDFEGDSHITHYTGKIAAEEWPLEVKRTVDILISAILIVILSPVFLLTAILIKLTSPGPILFMQKRLGLNKRGFHICKFRTMVPDAEQKMKDVEHLNEVSGPVFKIKNDPRITPIGKFLRRTSIDELPQLFNVLKGDMSLVGPRPLPVRDYVGFSEDWQRRRFSVRPGITCLWQISGRNSIPFEKWMELDLQYIDGWSLWLDLQILVKTIPAVLRGSGAA